MNREQIINKIKELVNELNLESKDGNILYGVYGQAALTIMNLFDNADNINLNVSKSTFDKILELKKYVNLGRKIFITENISITDDLDENKIKHNTNSIDGINVYNILYIGKRSKTESPLEFKFVRDTIQEKYEMYSRQADTCKYILSQFDYKSDCECNDCCEHNH